MLLTLTVLQPAVAAPAQGSVVRVLATACGREPYEATRLIELLRVELAQQGVSVQAAATEATPDPIVLAPNELALVTVTPEFCAPDAREVRLEVVDQVTSKRLERRMLIADVALAERPRALAISIAELLQAAWAETELQTRTEPPLLLPEAAREALMRRLRVRAPSAPELPGSSARPALRAAEPGSSRSWSLALMALVRTYPSAGTAWLGGDASTRWGLSDAVALRGGIEVATGAGTMGTESANGGLRNITGDTALGHVGVSLVTSGAPQLEVGPRLAVGYAHLVGDAKDESDAVVLLGFDGELRAALSPRWELAIGADIGHTLTGVSLTGFGASPTAVGNDGITTGLRLGAAFRP